MNVLLDDLNLTFVFNRRPTPLPADLRPLWRITLILLILLYSRGQKASLQKIHVLNWASKTEENRRLLINYMNGEVQKNKIIPRIEPSLNRAIDFAVAEKLIDIQNGKSLQLTAKGLVVANEIDEDADCFLVEKIFFQQIKKFVSETNIDNLSNWTSAS